MQHDLRAGVREDAPERREVERHRVDDVDVVGPEPDLDDAERGHERPLPDELGVEHDRLGGEAALDEGVEGVGGIDHARKQS